MSLDVVGGQRLFEPADVGGLVMAGAADRLVDVERLIGVGENLEVGSERRAQRIQSFDVLADRAPDLDLAAPEAERLRLERIVDQRLFRQMQPAALRGVKTDPVLGAARHHMQRKSGLPATQVPQSRVDRSER